jgi:hypothetical protein
MTDNPYTVEPRRIAKDQIERAYWDYYWSAQEIADFVGVYQRRVLDWMVEYDIPRRSMSEAVTISYLKKDGASIERISEEVTDPRVTATKPDEDADDHADDVEGVPWGEHD